MYTEEEAKTKWCPMVQICVTPNEVEGDNRGHGGHSYKCLGSDCMVWKELASKYIETGRVTFVKDEVKKQNKRVMETILQKTGFCGLIK